MRAMSLICTCEWPTQTCLQPQFGAIVYIIPCQVRNRCLPRSIRTIRGSTPPMSAAHGLFGSCYTVWLSWRCSIYLTGATLANLGMSNYLCISHTVASLEIASLPLTLRVPLFAEMGYILGSLNYFSATSADISHQSQHCFRGRCERLTASETPSTTALGLFLPRASFSLAMTEASSAICPSRATPPAAMHFDITTLAS